MSTQPLMDAPVGEIPSSRSDETVFLASVEGKAERKLIERWLAQRDNQAQVIFYDTPRDVPASKELIEALTGNDNLSDESILAPLRVIWRAPKRSGLHVPSWTDALFMRNPRDPNERTKQKLMENAPDRWAIAEAEPASLADLRTRWQVQSDSEDAADEDKFARFVARQAELALERAEYRLRGARYKIPRVYREDVAGSPRFRKGIAQLAAKLERSEDEVHTEAMRYLDELRTAHDPFVLDLATKFFHNMYAKGYGEADVDPAQIDMLRETFAKHPVILLPSHKTNLDSPVLEATLAQQNLPPPTLFAGINMSYWPVGPIMRRAGRVFLRRKISGNPIYKFALREWLGYLIEKRFNLEWFPEGTRSRTGKLLPPKLGLFSYAADAYRQGYVDDLMLVPISIIYDQATDVSGYAREAMGEKKKAENLTWMLKGMRELKKPQGKVYLRFAEPLSMRDALGPPDPGADEENDKMRLALHKLALAVSWRTNQVTPITGIAIVTCALLAAGQRAVTIKRILPYVRLLVLQARARNQPLTDSAQLETSEAVEDVLSDLARTGLVVRDDRGLETIYSIAEGQHLAAAFYRNSMLHFVLERAIGELALLIAAEAPPGARRASFWEAAVSLRESLKFEFFFRERPAFEESLEAEMDLSNPDWMDLLKSGKDPVAIHRSVYQLGIAHAVLRPFIEAYFVVFEVLRMEPPDSEFDESAFLDKCLKLGRQMLLQGELRNPESVSRPLFATGVQLVRNMKLVEPGPDLQKRRAQAAAQTRAMLERVDISEDNASRPQE